MGHVISMHHESKGIAHQSIGLEPLIGSGKPTNQATGRLVQFGAMPHSLGTIWEGRDDGWDPSHASGGEVKRFLL